MSQQLITQLTPEQEALIPVYKDKWRAIALSTEPIDRQKATEAVKAAYTMFGIEEPEILFCNNLYTDLSNIIASPQGNPLGSPLWLNLGNQLGNQLKSQLGNQLVRQLGNQLRSGLENSLWINLGRQLWTVRENQLHNQVARQLKSQFDSSIHSEPGLWYGSLLDFCISVLNCAHVQSEWQAFQGLANYCGWAFAFEKICIICDRPTKLSFDNQQRLHAEGEAAIQFVDGYSLYSYHGVTLPEKYGKLPPNQWQAQWLLEENNAELRRVLIQGIGYGRMCQELQTSELDSWKEYTLLQIDEYVEKLQPSSRNQLSEPMYLLKMLCPSTGHVHALRVPPDMKSAREAICWVNWGIDPEEFSAQT